MIHFKSECPGFFITLALASLILLVPISSPAHLGQSNIIQQAHIGPYPARITVKKPDVIPGIAQISIRFEGAPELDQVTVLPVQADLGRKGSPPPDPAKPVKGEPGLYHGELWIMTGVPHSIHVAASGSLGEGSAFVPFTPMATNTPSMGPFMTIILVALLTLLVVLLVCIIRQSVLYSTLPPTATPSRKRITAANLITVASLAVVATILHFGKAWWDSEEKHYTNNRLYVPAQATLTWHQLPESPRALRVDLSNINFKRRGPLVPDHGKLVHIYMVPVEEKSGSVAHLHPLKLTPGIFWTAVPDLPTGAYHVFADVTHETGYSQTLTGIIDLDRQPDPVEALEPIEQAWLKAELHLRDSDDSWLSNPVQTQSSVPDEFIMDSGIRIRWTGENVSDPAEQLRFELTHPDGSPVQTEPYLGMAAHAAIVGGNGTVYTHIHPAGTVSMAAMQLFELRDAGKITSDIGLNEPLCQLPSVDESQSRWLEMSASRKAGEIIFPYLPPTQGNYRVWIQFKLQNRIHTQFLAMSLRTQ